MPGINDLLGVKNQGGGFNKLLGSGAPQISTPDMRTPQEMEQQMGEPTKELPMGAVGFNPDGSANYGEGIQGWWNGITSRITMPTEEGEAPNIGQEVWRAGGEAIGQIVALASAPQQKYYEYLADRRSYEMYADMVNTNTPDPVADNEFGNFLRLTSAMVPGIANLTTMYDKERIKNGNRMLPDGTFEKIQEANRIWNKENVGTNIFNTQAQAEYVRRVLAGDDPYKLTKEYGKPVQNFIADVIIDPLNVFEGMGIANKLLGKGFKLAEGAVTAVRYLEDANKFEEAARAVEKVGEAKDVVTGVLKAVDDDIARVAAKVATETVEHVKDVLNIKTGAFELTQSSKIASLNDKTFSIFGLLLKFAQGDGAKYSDLMKAVSNLGSANVEEVKYGMKVLQDNKILHLFLSENAFETARFLNKISEKTAKFEKLVDVAKLDKAKYIEEWSKVVKSVVDDLYPDIAKIAQAQDEITKIRKIDKLAELPDNLKKFENIKLSPTAKFIAKRHNMLQTSWFGAKIGVQPINSFFAQIYLTSPGFSARNYLNAAATAFVDLGPSSLRELVDFTGGGFKYLEDMFGFVPGSIAKEFSLAQEAKKATGIMKYFDFMRQLAGKGEEFESVAIAAHAGKRFSKAMLKEGAFIEKTDALRKAGFSEKMTNFLVSKIRKYNGNTAKAMSEFRTEFAAGRLEIFREPEIAFGKELIDEIDNFSPHLLDELRDVMKTGTLEDMLGKVDNILNLTKNKMFSTMDDIPVDYADEASAAMEAMQTGLDLADDGIDQFAKKVTVRRHLEDTMLGTASEILPRAEAKLFSTGAVKFRDELRTVQNHLSTTTRQLVTDIRSGQLGVKELIAKIKADPMFAKFDQYAKLDATMDRDTAIDMIWTYYKKYMEDSWTEVARKQFDLLINTLGSTKLTGKKAAALDNLKIAFAEGHQYLNAEKLANGEAFINLPYYYYKMGKRVESVKAYAKSLGLLSSEFQKGEKLAKAIPYRATYTKLINEELQRLGLGKIGDLNKEDNYRRAIQVLNDYAVKRAKYDEVKRIVAEAKKAGDNPLLNDILREAKQALTGKGAGGNIDDVVKKLTDTMPEAKAMIDDVVSKVIPQDPAGMLSKIDTIPDVGADNMYDLAKALRAQAAGIERMFGNVKSSISKAYGSVEEAGDFGPDMEKALASWEKLNESKMMDFRIRAMAHMKQTRDFALLDYAGSKKNIDLALAYIFPYQFWYSRSYMNWIKRLVADPSIINKYAQYRDMMAEQNKNLPSYMQNYIVLGKSIGMEENPLMLNLEASLNPLNGITGVDFTDKNKIVGTPGTVEYAWTKTLDSIGKFGPSPWSPINMMTAAVLAGKGETEAASRWAGRFLPQSAPIKAVGSLFNQNWEVDPFVLLFGTTGETGFADPYESRRIGRALIALTESGKITKEQAYEAARTKSGQAWDEAKIFSTKNRAAGTISAYVLGQGFKIRSGYEAEIDKFYEEYFQMWANADKFTPDEMSNYQRYIRQKYNFADLVILSGKGSDERDKAYSYSVLSRIAPGQSSDIMKALGVNPNLSDKFYTDKGDMTQWNALDKESFMNAMVQVGTLLAIPNDTTAAEWQNVKIIYKQVDKDIQARYGEDILQKIEAFYEFTYDSAEQKNYVEAHPEVTEALDFKDYLISGNKDIAPYYDGLNRLERYYDGEFRRQVTTKIDPNYYEYYKIRGMIIDPKEQKAFDKQVNWTGLQKQYNALKKEWDIYTFKQLDNYDKFFLGKPIGATMQPGVSMSVGQQAIAEVLAPSREQERQVTWQQITSAIPMPITLERALNQYVTTDRQLSSAESSMVTRLLANVNNMYGTNLTKDDLLSLAMDYYK